MSFDFCEEINVKCACGYIHSMGARTTKSSKLLQGRIGMYFKVGRPTLPSQIPPSMMLIDAIIALKVGQPSYN